MSARAMVLQPVALRDRTGALQPYSSARTPTPAAAAPRPPEQTPLPNAPAEPAEMHGLRTFRTWLLPVMLAVTLGVLLFLLRTAPPDGPADVRSALAGTHARPRDGTAIPVHSPPAVEPLVFIAMDRGRARAINAAIGFQPLGPDRPAPFVLPTGSPDFERARDCLASALWYEAGDDRSGQQAVAQVVLNRMRHPAFPHSVCGVVFQGAERRTGCQFTFTCDGALARHPSALAWQRAQGTAAAFLSAQTDPRVGMATHYHTDWVHPYWSASLDKIAQVGTHLFFRWQGAWGRRVAFTSAYAGQEQSLPQLAFLSSAHAGVSAPRLAYDLDMAASQPAARPVPGSSPDLLARRDGDHFITVDATGDGSALAMEGLGACRGQSYCKVVGWDRRGQRFGSPDNPLIRTVAFLYVSDRRTGVEIVLWDCDRYNRPLDSQCLSDANRRWITFQGDLSRAS